MNKFERKLKKNTDRRAKSHRKSSPKLDRPPEEPQFPLPIRSPRAPRSPATESFPDSTLDEIEHDILDLSPKTIRKEESVELTRRETSPRFRNFKSIRLNEEDELRTSLTLDSIKGFNMMAKLGKGFYGRGNLEEYIGNDEVESLLPLTQTKSFTNPSGNKKITLENKTVSANGLTQFSDYLDPWVQQQRQKVLEEVDSSIESILSDEEKQKHRKSLKKQNLIAASSEFFLATISGPNYVETTRSYKENLAARSISTYPCGEFARAGDPIADFYFARVFGSACVLALADGCNWGDPPKEAACVAASSFVRYIQDRLHLCVHTHKAAEIIINGFSVAHDSILRGHKRNVFAAGTTTLLGAILVPILDSNSIVAFQEMRKSSSPSPAITISPKITNRSRSADPTQMNAILKDEKTSSKKKKKNYTKKTSPRAHRKKEPEETSSSPRSPRSLRNSMNGYSKVTIEDFTSEHRSPFHLRRASETFEDHLTSADQTDEMPTIPELPSLIPKRKIRTRGMTVSNIQRESRAFTKKKKKAKWAFVYGNVGDCKVFLYSWKKKLVSDVTYASRDNSMNASDCGGRLGPYKKGGLPDMRNFCVSSCTVRPDDLLIVVSDGVHDNLDPQYLGKTPRDLHINEDDWDEVELRVANLAKQKFREQKLLEILSVSDSLTPTIVCDLLTDYSYQVTSAGRNFMEQNPSLELPPDYSAYPGKMDHTSVICCKVDTPGSDSTELLRNAFEKKESIYLPGQITRRDLERATFN